MKGQSVNLRQAFAANPVRFLAGTAPRQTAVTSTTAQVRILRQFPLTAPPTPHAKAHPLVDQLRLLDLHGMAEAFAQVAAQRSVKTTSIARWLSFLVEGEVAERKKKRMASRLRAARLRYRASIAEVDYNAVRGFDDALFHHLANGQWIEIRENLVIDGPTGVGKTWLACALGEMACSADHSVRYERVPQLLADLDILRGTLPYSRRMRALHNPELLILDDWGLKPFGFEQRHDMLEIIEGRYGRSSTLIASQVPLESWPGLIGDGDAAAMMLDRFLHNVHRLQLNGESLRDESKHQRPTDLAL